MVRGLVEGRAHEVEATSNRLQTVAAWARRACLGFALLALVLILFRPVLDLYPAPGHAWVLVPVFPPWGLWLMAGLLAVLTLFALLGGAPHSNWRSRLVVAGAPWLAGLVWVSPLLPSPMRAFVCFYLPIFWVVTLLFQWHASAVEKKQPDRPWTRTFSLGFLVAATLFYMATGLYYTLQCGPHAGDEGYYLIQVDSLYRDGDTDIRNDLGTKISRHISPNTRLPHYYSYHPPGLPFLLTPVYPLGLWGRHLVLGLIAALGLWAVLELSRRLGLARGPALLLVLVHGFTIYWVVYSSRCLPEMLGATLVALVFWASARQQEHPWQSAVVAAVATAYLPLASIRFTPVVAGCALFYLVAGLLDARPARAKVRPLAAWAVLLAAAVGLVHFYQWTRFEHGLSHPVGDMLFSNPRGAWHALSHYKGITNVFPLYLWLVVANLVWLVRAPATRWYALGALGLFVGVWLTSSTVSDWGGGSTLGGRFLVVAMLPLLPGAAWWWTRCSAPARWTMLFLAGISIALVLWQWALLPRLGGNFGRPWGELLEVAPALVGIRYFLAQPSLWFWLAAGTLAVVVLPAARERWGWGLIAVTLAAGAVIHLCSEPIKYFAPYYHDFAASPSVLAEQLRTVNLDHYRWSRRTQANPTPLFSVSDRFFLSYRTNNLMSVYTYAPQGETLWHVDYSRIAPNDWQKRPLSWATLKDPFDAGRGERVLLLQGRVEGDVKAHFAVVEGNRTLYEAPLETGPGGQVDLTARVTCRGRGHVYLLLRLEGAPGAFIGQRIAWSPYREDLFTPVGLPL